MYILEGGKVSVVARSTNGEEKTVSFWKRSLRKNRDIYLRIFRSKINCNMYTIALICFKKYFFSSDNNLFIFIVSLFFYSLLKLEKHCYLWRASHFIFKIYFFAIFVLLKSFYIRFSTFEGMSINYTV